MTGLNERVWNRVRTLGATLLVCGIAGSMTIGAVEPGASAQDPPALTWGERYLLLGQETYEHACASCHDEGTDGAPVTGNRDDWSDRSPLWSAVLLEHAKHGYLDMPAKGGHAGLTDRSVEAAGEYMLSVTFPELLRD